MGLGQGTHQALHRLELRDGLRVHWQLLTRVRGRVRQLLTRVRGRVRQLLTGVRGRVRQLLTGVRGRVRARVGVGARARAMAGGGGLLGELVKGWG